MRRLVFISFLVSLPFWWGASILQENLTEAFFWNQISADPQLMLAQANVEQRFYDLKPIRNNGVGDLDIEAKAAISVFVDGNGKEKVLFERGVDKRLPIASLSKLMTAFVVLKHYDLEKEIVVSKEAVSQEEDFGKLESGKELSVKYLLHPLLIESSNDAAFALAQDYDGMTEKSFISLMNQEASNVGMVNTLFVNVTGLDPDPPNTAITYSSVSDLVELTKNLLEKDLVWEILSIKTYNEYGPELISTNELLDNPRVIGGKTGYTDEAGGCLLIVSNAPKNQGKIINVILASADRFSEMESLLHWTETGFNW